MIRTTQLWWSRSQTFEPSLFDLPIALGHLTLEESHELARIGFRCYFLEVVLTQCFSRTRLDFRNTDIGIAEVEDELCFDEFTTA